MITDHRYARTFYTRFADYVNIEIKLVLFAKPNRLIGLYRQLATTYIHIRLFMFVGG